LLEADVRTDSRHRLQPSCHIRFGRHFLDLLGFGFDPNCLLADLRKKIPAFLVDQGGQVAVWLVEKRLDPSEMDNALRDCVSLNSF
jgi:hypothetical protein